MGEEPSPGGFFGSVFDFLKILGASLTGITAILTAAGFLAERSRLAMLGLPSSTFDLEQYVETGALLLALLPVVMGLALLLIFLSWVKALATVGIGYAMTLFLGSLAVLALYLWVRPRFGNESASSRKAVWKRRFTAGNRRLRGWGFGLVLALALALQITSVAREVAVLEIRDVLFTSEVEPAVATTDAEAPEEMLMSVGDARGDRNRPVRIFGEIVLLTVFNASVIFYVIRRRRPAARSIGKQWVLTGWIGVSTLLFVSQITLLPVSYGVIVSRNAYPEVCAAVSNEAQIDGEPLPDTRLSLVHQTGDGFYFYSRGKRKMWYVPRGAVQSLVHHAKTNILDRAEPKDCPTEELL